jgi:hypothetical protein
MKNKYIIQTLTLAIILSSMIIGAAVIANLIFNNTKEPDLKSNDITAKEEFPSPAKKNIKFYSLQSIGYIQFSVSPIITNMTNDPIHGGSIFEIDYYNSTASPIDLSDNKQLDIGCVAENDGKSYRTIKEYGDIFTKTVNNISHSGSELSTVNGFEHKKVTIEVYPTCKYIGTADLQYSWQVK